MDPTSVDADLLDRLVTILDTTAAEEGWHQPHSLVSVTGADESAFELGLKRLADDEHPLDHLLGFVAPAEWRAVGLVSYGWAAPLDGEPAATLPPSEHPERVRVRSVHLVGRDGAEAATTAFEDGRAIDQPSGGVVADSLRRAMGTPTPPPAEPVLELIAAIWLEHAIAKVCDDVLIGVVPGATGSRGRRRGRLTWAALAAQNPLLARARAGGLRLGARRLPDIGLTFASFVTWSDLRWESMTGARPWGIAVDPDLAAWMDDGMYARWLLDGRLPSEMLAAELAPFCSPDCRRRLDECLRCWGLAGSGVLDASAAV